MRSPSDRPREIPDKVIAALTTRSPATWNASEQLLLNRPESRENEHSPAPFTLVGTRAARRDRIELSGGASGARGRREREGAAVAMVEPGRRRWGWGKEGVKIGWGRIEVAGQEAVGMGEGGGKDRGEGRGDG